MFGFAEKFLRVGRVFNITATKIDTQNTHVPANYAGHLKSQINPIFG